MASSKPMNHQLQLLKDALPDRVAGVLTEPVNKHPELPDMLITSIDAQAVHRCQLESVLGGWGAAQLSHIYNVYRQDWTGNSDSNSNSNNNSNSNINNSSSNNSNSSSSPITNNKSNDDRSSLLDLSNDAVIQYQRISNKIRQLKHLDESRVKQESELAGLLSDILDIESHIPPANGSDPAAEQAKRELKSISKGMRPYEFNFLSQLLGLGGEEWSSYCQAELARNQNSNSNGSSSGGGIGFGKPPSGSDRRKAPSSSSSCDNTAASVSPSPLNEGYDPETPLSLASQRRLDAISMKVDAYVNGAVRGSVMSVSSSALAEAKYYETVLKALHRGQENKGRQDEAIRSDDVATSDDGEAKHSLKELGNAFDMYSDAYFDFNRLAHTLLLDSFIKRPVAVEDLPSIAEEVDYDISQLVNEEGVSFNPDCSPKDLPADSIHMLIKQLLFGANFDPTIDPSSRAHLLDGNRDSQPEALTASHSSNPDTSPSLIKNLFDAQFASPDADLARLAELRSRHQELLIRVKSAFADYSPFDAELIFAHLDGSSSNSANRNSNSASNTNTNANSDSNSNNCNNRSSTRGNPVIDNERDRQHK